MVLLDASREPNLIRVTFTVRPADIDLLDRLARLEGSNRSAELRGILDQIRPVMLATVQAFEAALNQRRQLDAATAAATVSQLQQVLPEVERVQNAYLGVISRLEGLEAADPRPSNHGGHNPHPHPLPTDEDDA